ncbi:MAG: tetratricopeptide repeat protein [Planctomycetota bacterium]
MRRSRLYLALSILSLVFGVALGQAQDHCAGRECPFSVCDTDDCQSPDTIRFGSDPEFHLDEAFRSVQTRDYSTMQRHAAALLKYDNTDPISHELLAYSLRGQEQYAESIEAYEKAIDLGLEGRYPNIMVVCDSYIGIAANYDASGEHEKAIENIENALRIAEERRKLEQSDDAYYQLACAYAVRSGMELGKQSAKDRGSAIANLKFAIVKGFNNWDHMRGDLDLKALHGHAAFNELFPKNQ